MVGGEHKESNSEFYSVLMKFTMLVDETPKNNLGREGTFFRIKF